MKRIIGVVAVALAAVLGGMNSDAQADHHSHRSSRSHSHYGSSSRFQISVGGFNFGSGYGGYGGYGGYSDYDNCSRRSPVYHDTSHYDYHPTQIVPHRNHYHVIPGHYDYHQTGHWHY